MAIQRFAHVGLCVSDLARSAAFYREGLGFRETAELASGGEATARLLELPDVKLEARYLEREGFRLELLAYPTPGSVGDGAPRAMNALGLTHLSFRVSDLDLAAAALVTAGGRVLERTRISNPAHGMAAVFALDPDGTRIELVLAPGDPAAPLGRPRARA